LSEFYPFLAFCVLQLKYNGRYGKVGKEKIEEFPTLREGEIAERRRTYYFVSAVFGAAGALFLSAGGFPGTEGMI
jgi:hypothetical protein